MKQRVTQEEWDQSPEAMLLRAEEDRREGELGFRAFGALDRLTDLQREVAVWRWVRGAGRKTTADALNLTIQGVRTIEEAARRRLIDLLAEEEIA